MTRVVAARLLQAVAVLWAVGTLMFFLLRLAGDPLSLLLPEDFPQPLREAVRVELGLDGPLWWQYLQFLSNALRGNLGFSFYHRQPAMLLVLERVPASLELVAGAMGLALAAAIPLGVISAIRRGSLVDRGSLFASLVGISAPPFWIGIMLILVFTVQLGWFPSSGRGGLRYLVLPALSLSFSRIALLVRLVRAGMLDVLGQDYIRTARAKGLPERVVVFKHALKNTLIPVTTVAGLQMGALLAGAIVTERIFAWPGMGRLALDAIDRLDYPVVIAYALVVAAAFVVTNLVVDLTYSLLDPKVRYT